MTANTNIDAAIDWDKVQTVLFDMDGTLLDLHFDNHFWLEHLPVRYAQHHRVDLAWAKQHLYERFGAKRGQLDWYCVDYWSRELDLDIAALKEEIADRILVRPGMIEFLDWLGQCKKQRILATNAHRKSLAIKLARTGIGAHFDHIVSSHDYGYAKEQDEFWHTLKSRLHISLAHSVFVDDSLDVLRAAQRNGVAYILAVPDPDSRQPSKDTAEFIAISDFTALIRT